MRIVVTLLFVFVAKTSVHAQKNLFVDGRNGSDSNPGSIDKPFKTITYARDYIRHMKNTSKLPAGGVVVNIREGNYDFTSGPLELTQGDSGQSGSPIVYQGYEQEKVILLGGKQIPNDQFIPVTDQNVLGLLPSHVQDNIIQADLKKLGISNYGDLETGQLGNCANDKLELFVDEFRMTLARYPNINQNGSWNFIQVAKVINNETFQFSDTRINQWKDTSTMWLHGYWEYDWADNYVKVLSVNHASNEIIIDSKTPTLYSVHEKARFYCVNILEELDVPTEYYVNRTSGTLYFYPPKNWKTSKAFVSVGESLLTINQVSYVTIKGLRMWYSRTTAVQVSEASNVQIMDCDISLHGTSSISLHGTDCVVQGIRAYRNGCGGIDVSGGDQKSLTRGNNLLTKCSISHYANWKRTYQPAIGWSGVGNNFTFNYISDAPHTGILGGGNDCLFEYNTISGLCYEATDTGAFYTGRNWIDRGNVIRYSTFENIKMTEKTVLGAMSVQAIYLDDQMSGYEIYNNTFKNCYVGTFIGGGRHNHVHHNHYYDCNTAVHVDNRGMNWQKSDCSPGGEFEQQLNSVNYQQPPWSQHYPFLVNIFNDHPCVPVYNNITDNTYCHTGQFTDLSTDNAKQWIDNVINNKECINCGFKKYGLILWCLYTVAT
ncbi:uncharacterized protein [Dysidea avara]|uniref:uncharacterized protein isoform X2 n=1 Tax=Dysidea avara TaxID=196820 RepID=UPI00332B3995